ncbi:MAG: glycosyltransferase family 2 protein, partial [Bacteroidota bacterium]
MIAGFSIIVTNYNKAQYIEEALFSVLNQNTNDFEILLYDDCSTDNSKEIIERSLSFSNKIHFFKNDVNRGANYLRNKGIFEAKYDHIIFLDADDLLGANCINSRVEFIQKNDEFDMWVFPMFSFKKNISNIISTWIPPTDNLLERFLTHRLPWTISQVVWSTEFLRKINGFDLNFKRFQDVELHTKALLNKAKVMISRTSPDCYYRVDEDRIINYETHFKNFASGAIMYFEKFYTSVKQNKLLFVTLLYSIDSISYALRSNKLSLQFCNQTVDRILNESYT